MGTLGLSALLATVFVGSAVAVQILERKRNRARLKGLELRPNCLLTRYPIAFVAGRRSLFRLTDHWNCIPHYLREHGYEVLVIEPAPGKSPLNSITAALGEAGGRFHLIADSSGEALLQGVARAKMANVASLTVVRNEVAREEQEPVVFSADALTPLPSAVEIFNVKRPTGPLAIYDRAALALLWLHNLVFMRGKKIDPTETGAGLSRAAWKLEARFLDLAISLAERDARWSD